MILFKRSKDLQSYLNSAIRKEIFIGFVPTMGALHKGHLSLIEQSRLKSHITICSIFVNPVQFNNKEDFTKYPATLEKDILLLEESGCDILFIPGEGELYPDADSRIKHFELGYLEKILEGKSRPGHFQGVCLVVEKLLNIVNPSFLFLGQKDYQQCLVIKRLVDLIDKDVEIAICPILRESNGLAMSSRNLRLNAEDKVLASELYKTLARITTKIAPGNFSYLKKEAIVHLEGAGFTMDYLELAKSATLEIVEDCDSREKYVVLIAAFLSNIRLIDNMGVTGQC